MSIIVEQPVAVGLLKSSAASVVASAKPIQFVPLTIIGRLHHQYDGQPIVHGQQLCITLPDTQHHLWCTCLVRDADREPALLTSSTCLRIDSLSYQNLHVTF